MNKERFMFLASIGVLALLFTVLHFFTWYQNRQQYEALLEEIRALRTPIAELEAGGSHAEPFTIAFLSDTETLSRWDEVLHLIADEGAHMIVHQGDYIDGLNPELMQPVTFNDWAGTPIANAEGNQSFDCERPLQGIRCILGGDFPVLGAATGLQLGEEFEQYFFETVTRIEQQGGQWGGCIMDGDPGTRGVRMVGCYTDDNLATARAADYWVRWNGITLVFQNAMPDTSWAPEVLQGDENIWKVCLWHGNHVDFQTGEKGAGYDGDDHSLPYEMYRGCAEYGALIINGNEHTYSRTCVLEDIGNMDNGGPSYPNRVNREPGTELENHGADCPNAGVPNEEAVDVVEELEIGPGRSLVLVSAVPGYAWRDYIPKTNSLIAQDAYRHDQDGWWATIFTANRYCRNNCTLGDLSGQNSEAFVPGMNPPNKIEEAPGAPWDPYSDAHGVLFITFNYEGDPYKAHGYFKKLTPDPGTGRQIVDEFIITYRP